MKTWQIFYCEKQKDGTWWYGKRPMEVIFDKVKAERLLSRLKNNASINQYYIMIDT
jgi:hypothetical protein